MGHDIPISYFKSINDSYESHMRNSSPMKLLFGQDYQNWDHQDSILSSVTPYQVSIKVAEIASRLYPSANTLWDPFGGSGVDTVSFSKYFNTITGEVDSDMYQIMTLNIERHHDSHYVSDHYLGDATVYRPPYADLVYLDPPWGEGFRNFDNFNLMDVTLNNGNTIMSLIENIRKEVSNNIIVKSPLKDDGQFREIWGDRVTHEVHFDKFRLKFFYLH